MLPADNTGGREARSPALAAAARARRTRLERVRQGLDSGTTPAATAAQVPAITPAVGTADAMDGLGEWPLSLLTANPERILVVTFNSASSTLLRADPPMKITLIQTDPTLSANAKTQKS